MASEKTVQTLICKLSFDAQLFSIVETIMSYCSECHHKLTTEQPEFFVNDAWEEYKYTLDWCHRCQDVVETTQFSVPLWTIVAMLGLLYCVPM